MPELGATRPRLLLLDGHSLAYRAFFALPVENFSTTTGQATNAVYGFTSMLINTLRDEQPTHIAVAFDVSRQTFRTEMFPDYKATRSASPEEFKGQIPLILEVLEALGIPSLQLEGYEADDIIATLATRAENADYDVFILTGDRDAFQLVDDRVTVLYPRKGVSDLARMDPAAIEERFGLTPKQYADYAALRGDPSDNLPSVPGVGEKTAAKWVREYGSLEQLTARADELPGKVGQSLRDHLDQVVLNRQLTELVREAPLPAAFDDPADLVRTPIDRQRVHEVFDALQFRVLRDRLFDSLGQTVAPASGSFDLEVAALSPGEVATWLSSHAVGRCGVEVEGEWGRGTGVLRSIAVAAPDGAVAWMTPVTWTSEDETAVAAWLADPAAPLAMHDAKGPLLAMAARGWSIAGLAADTALMAYLVLPGQRSFDLGDLTARFLGRQLEDSTSDSGQLSFDTEEASAGQVGLRARAVLDLAEVLESEVAVRGGTRLLNDVELPLVSVLARMEELGIAVDLGLLTELDDSFGDSARGAETEAYSMVGRTFNLGSPKQLQEILFVERGLPKTKKIKTGYTTDAEALQSLYERTEDPLLGVLLRWRDVTKLRQTVAGLIPLTDANSRIHTTYAQTVAATGRLSSVDPNLQNIPIRTEEGRRIRGAFVVGDGFECLLTADYSQIEMRIMAHLSDDPGLIAAFNEGEDLHSTVASRVFEVPADDVDAEMRRRIKAMSYGLVYGLSTYGLSQQLGVSTGDAQTLMDHYFERFGGVRDYLSEVVADARVTGYTETIMGRRRYLPDLTSDVRQRRDMAERMALNAPIQGSAADVIKVAMINVVQRLEREQRSSRLLLQVHDELVLEVATGERDSVTTLVREEMAGAAELKVPLEVSVGFGHTWDEAAH
ncbi:MAG: DNA polymerase I [Actinobacteria bacterium]|nr:DNA polymerase I [Actinomycetota bacterium]